MFYDPPITSFPLVITSTTCITQIKRLLVTCWSLCICLRMIVMSFNFGSGFHPQVFHERLCSCIMFPVYYSLGRMQQSSPSLFSCYRAVVGCWGSFSAQWVCCGEHGVAHQKMLRMKMPIVCGLMRSLCPLLSGHVRIPADVVIVRLYFVKGRVPIYPSTQYWDTWPLHQKGLDTTF